MKIFVVIVVNNIVAAKTPTTPSGPDSEAQNGTRGWEGNGWGNYNYETEVTQEMTVFKTEVYRLAFKNGQVFLAPGATCEFIRRRGQACPDKYDANNVLVPNWEAEQRKNLFLTFPGKPPGTNIGAYPPGRWAHVRITMSLKNPEVEAGLRVVAHFIHPPAHPRKGLHLSSISRSHHHRR